MTRLREILRTVPAAQLAEDLAGAAMLAAFVLHLPMFLALAAALLEAAR